MKKRAYGKINLGLKVVSKRTDGFHNLEMIVAKIDLFDEIEFKESGSLEVVCDGVAQEDNLVYKVAKYLKERYYVKKGIKIIINKNIPMGAGLGGGSSDAACAINTLNELWGLSLKENEKQEIALMFGSDIPFFINNNIAYATGRGEILEEIELKREVKLLIVKPQESVSTKDVFKKVVVDGEKSNIKKAVEKIENDNIREAIVMLNNDLEKYTNVLLCGKIELIKNKMKEFGCFKSIMSGSGSSVIAFFDEEEKAKKAKEYFEKENYFTCETKIMGDVFE